MLKTLRLGICIFIGGSFHSAWAGEAIKTGQFDLKAGAGLLYLMEDFKDNATTSFHSNVPMPFIGMDMGLADNWSIGIAPTYSGGFESKFKDQFNTEDKTMSAIGFITDSKYYLPFAPAGIVPYGRVDFGLHIWTWEQDRSGVSSSSSGFTTSYGLYAGGKYSLSDRFYAFAELGYGWTLLNAGVAFRIFEN